MKCPVCSASLRASRYEGLPVFTCDACSGYLVATRRVTDIKRRRMTTKAELIEEAAIDGETDSKDRLRCPRCKGWMQKQSWAEHPSFHLDVCQNCDFVWFDTGELARLQLDFELSDRGQEAARFQDRLKNMTPAEKEEFESALAELPEGDATLASAFGAGLTESFLKLADELLRR